MTAHRFSIIELHAGGDPDVVANYHSLEEACLEVKRLNHARSRFRVRDETNGEYIAGRPNSTSGQ